MNFEVRGGGFAYPGGAPVLSGVNLSLPAGQILCVLGANGSGKTTLLKCALGLLRWTEGASYLDGADIRGLKAGALWRRAAYVPQARPPVFGYTGLEMALLGRGAHLGLFRQPGRRDVELALEALDTVGASHLAHRQLSRVSGGELQLVLIARALAAQPELLVLDEPEAGLDLRNRLLVLDTLSRLREARGLSFIVNTHQPEHAFAIADQALLLCEGAAQGGPVAEVLTEENLRRAFGVAVRVHRLGAGEGGYTCVVPAMPAKHNK